MTFLRFSLLLLTFAGAQSQSVKSCGGPNDHLKNPVIKLIPDPPTKGGSLTIEASGTLDEVMSGMNSNVDLQIQALGIIKASVKGGIPMSISPGFVAGPFALTVGPFKLPSNVPGSAVVKGQIHVVNDKNEPIMCIDMDLNVPGAENEVLQVPQLEAPETITSCAKPTDHIPDFKLDSSGGVITMTGTLDETVTKSSIDLDVKLKVLFITVPLKMSIPMAITPGAPKGAIKATLGPSTIALSPDVKAKMTGTVKVNDGNGEEITCLNVDTVVSGTDRVSSIVV
jgi:hypothetical protein